MSSSGCLGVCETVSCEPLLVLYASSDRCCRLVAVLRIRFARDSLTRATSIDSAIGKVHGLPPLCSMFFPLSHIVSDLLKRSLAVQLCRSRYDFYNHELVDISHVGLSRDPATSAARVRRRGRALSHTYSCRHATSTVHMCYDQGDPSLAAGGSSWTVSRPTR